MPEKDGLCRRDLKATQRKQSNAGMLTALILAQVSPFYDAPVQGGGDTTPPPAF